jgi:hypothetical protein
MNMPESGEIGVYGLNGIDEIMLSTPDALLSGAALEGVIKSCAPDVKNVKKLLVPDLEAIFLAMKIATSGKTFEISKICNKCNHEMTFDVNLDHLLGTMTAIEDSDTKINLNNELEIHIKPYTLEMRRSFVEKQFEEDRLLKLIDANNKNLDELHKADVLQKSVEKISRITFDLVSKSITSIRLIKQGSTVNNPTDISEWLVNIPKNQADLIFNKVNALNEIGINRSIDIECDKCHHTWKDSLNLDPSSFFPKPSRP